MTFRYSYILPILCAVLIYTTFIVTYLISVLNKHVTPIFPYISDTGTWSPESCIFGIMLNIGALIQALIMYIRYLQIEAVIEKETHLSNSLKRINFISLCFGFAAAFGVCVVGNFQETNLFTIHVGGALIAFGSGSIYQCLQTKISFCVYPATGTKKINYFRLICCVIGCVMFVMSFGCAALAAREFTGKDPTKWSDKDGGYISHLISAITEWIMAISSNLFLLLYTQEFKDIVFIKPVLNLKV